MNAQDGAAVGLGSRLALCMGRNMHIATEIAFERRREYERDSLNRQVRWKRDRPHRVASLLFQVGDGKRRGEERLRLAAGWYRHSLDHLRCGHKRGSPGRGRYGKHNMQEVKAGLLQVQRRVARKMLRGQVEEGVLAQAGWRASGRVHSRNRRGREIVLHCQVKRYLSVGTRWHLQIEDKRSILHPQVQNTRRVALRLLRLTQGDGVRNLAAILVEPQIF